MIEAKNISCVLITKDATYPEEIWSRIVKIGFGEILMLANCPSPSCKQELFQKAKYDYLYYQDDDCIAPIELLLAHAQPDKITCAMKSGHIRAYANSRIALLGWGSIFPKSVISVLDKYREKFGEDDIYKRETERIMTSLAYDQQVRLELPIVDLPSAFAPDRLSMQPGHYDYIPIVEQRCAELL